MHAAEQTRCDGLYRRHLRALKLQGMSDSTIDVYARALRRVAQYDDCCPDRLTTEQLEVYFADLVASHSWSTVKVDRHGLQCFWKHVLKRAWQWVAMIKAPTGRSLPAMLTLAEVEQLLGATRTLRYRVFLLATDSMGLRLGETLALQVPVKRDIARSRAKTVSGWCCNTFYPKAFAASEIMVCYTAMPNSCWLWGNAPSRA